MRPTEQSLGSDPQSMPCPRVSLHLRLPVEGAPYRPEERGFLQCCWARGPGCFQGLEREPSHPPAEPRQQEPGQGGRLLQGWEGLPGKWPSLRPLLPTPRGQGTAATTCKVNGGKGAWCGGWGPGHMRAWGRGSGGPNPEWLLHASPRGSGAPGRGFARCQLLRDRSAAAQL